MSDVLLDPNEELMMDEFKREIALSPNEESGYLELDGIDDTFKTGREQTIVVLNLLRLSYVDGEFDIEEECLLKEITRVFGIDDEVFRLMDNRVKRFVALEREAHDFMND